MKIYVASSWRNAHQPKVVEVLRSAGHEVYDFRNPAPGNEGFSWRQVDPTYERGALVSADHWRRLVDSPVALEGHAHDLGAMKWADACVYVLPCGRSASFEAGWFQGQGKPLAVLALEPTEPELMFRDADIVGSLAAMLDAVTRLAASPALQPAPVATDKHGNTLVPCATCGDVTAYIATETCDPCWEKAHPAPAAAPQLSVPAEPRACGHSPCCAWHFTGGPKGPCIDEMYGAPAAPPAGTAPHVCVAGCSHSPPKMERKP